jgi:glycosyltransferase involved in cell wall biosynthesis
MLMLASRHNFWADYPKPEFLPSIVVNDPSLPVVSIVTPSYNQGRFIRETIESVLTQDYPNIEYWVIDGGSTDATVSILREYESDRRFHWLSEPDRGQADAVNKGWRRAQGEILGWLNSDDTYLPGALKAQALALIAHPAVGVVYGDAIFTNPHGHPLQRYHTRPFDRRRFLHLSAIPQPSALIRHSLVMRHGGLDTQLHYALDYELFLRLMWETTFLYTGTLVASYRLHDTSKTRDGYDRMLGEAIAVVRKTCRQHPAELSGEMRKAIGDWYWQGAIQSVEAGAYRKALKYGLSALLEHPLRPRAGTFGLTLFDSLFKTRTSDWLVSKLDQRTHQQELSSK